MVLFYVNTQLCVYRSLHSFFVNKLINIIFYSPKKQIYPPPNVLSKPQRKYENRLFIATKMLCWQEWVAMGQLCVCEGVCVHCCAVSRRGIQNEIYTPCWT